MRYTRYITQLIINHPKQLKKSSLIFWRRLPFQSIQIYIFCFLLCIFPVFVKKKKKTKNKTFGPHEVEKEGLIAYSDAPKKGEGEGEGEGELLQNKKINFPKRKDFTSVAVPVGNIVKPLFHRFRSFNSH